MSKRVSGPKSSRQTKPPKAISAQAAAKKTRAKNAQTAKLYTLEVALIGGLVDEDFARKNPVVSRTIQIPGTLTLEDLHSAIFDAFDRYDEHLWEFQFGKRPMDRTAVRYTVPNLGPDPFGDEDGALPGDIPIEQLALRPKKSFFYWFDFGDDWWHKITVRKIEDFDGEGKYPKVVEKIGASPPQYPGYDEE